jgi:hypothetical protein
MSFRDRIEWLLKSFENTDEGASSRRLSIFVVMLCVIFIHIFFLSIDTARDFLIVDFVFILMLYNLISERGLLDIFGTKFPKAKQVIETTVDGTTGTTKETVTKETVGKNAN